MTAPRLLLAALLLCTAALGLSACTPVDEDPTVAAGGEFDDGDDDGDGADGPAVALVSPAAAACTTAAERPGHRVLQVVTVARDQLTARPTRFVCGPDIPDDGYYEPTGSPARYTFAATATATLVDLEHAEPARPVPVPELVDHLDDCLADREPEPPYGCYGSDYDVVLDSRGRIMRIGELYHP
ncbi:hypothetical protein [Kitasatospora sp. NPDC087315]|uniref:hypothetical protein n=1 Tax=Kitasatospora sp. NPDC087315 TaxID=3364069 RepID=UPI00382EE88C